MKSAKKSSTSSKKVFASATAIIAGVAIVLLNLKTIKEILWPQVFPDKPTIGWLIVSSQGQLRCVVPDEMRFNLGDGRNVSVLKSLCAETLHDKGKIETVAREGETVQNARFLLIKNSSDAKIDRLKMLDRDGNALASSNSLDKDETLAICVSYEGKGGTIGVTHNPATISLNVYGDVVPRTVAIPPVPKPAETRGVGAAGCHLVAYGYPPQ
jgi:hypothetical protein